MSSVAIRPADACLRRAADVARVAFMQEMFDQASAFNQRLDAWNVRRVGTMQLTTDKTMGMDRMLDGTALSKCNKLAVHMSFEAQVPAVWSYNWSTAAPACPWPPPLPPLLPPELPPRPPQVPDLPTRLMRPSPLPPLHEPLPSPSTPWTWALVGLAAVVLPSGVVCFYYRRAARRAMERTGHLVASRDRVEMDVRLLAHQVHASSDAGPSGTPPASVPPAPPSSTRENESAGSVAPGSSTAEGSASSAGDNMSEREFASFFNDSMFEEGSNINSEPASRPQGSSAASSQVSHAPSAGEGSSTASQELMPIRSSAPSDVGSEATTSAQAASSCTAATEAGEAPHSSEPAPRARPAVARPKKLADSGFSPGDEVSVLKWGSVIATGSIIEKRFGFFRVQSATGEVINARSTDLRANDADLLALGATAPLAYAPPEPPRQSIDHAACSSNKAPDGASRRSREGADPEAKKKQRKGRGVDAGIKIGDEVTVRKWGQAVSSGRVVGRRQGASAARRAHAPGTVSPPLRCAATIAGYYQVQTATGETVNARVSDLMPANTTTAMSVRCAESIPEDLQGR
jgi:hypothetical protein